MERKKIKIDMTIYSINNKIIRKEITANCSVKAAWEKWTTHDGLKTFFGADNKIELQIGGAFEIYFLMDNEYGLRGSETCKIVSYLPDKMLSFSWNAPPNFEFVRNHEHKTWVVILFHVIDDKRTKIEINHLGWIDDEQFDKVYDYFNSAWQVVLNNFEKSCNS
jgi:uncharacterized protein YndB with AHSA1/START domain